VKLALFEKSSRKGVFQDSRKFGDAEFGGDEQQCTPNGRGGVRKKPRKLAKLVGQG